MRKFMAVYFEITQLNPGNENHGRESIGGFLAKKGVHPKVEGEKVPGHYSHMEYVEKHEN